MSLQVCSRWEGVLLRAVVPCVTSHRGRIKVDTRKPRQPQWAKFKLIAYTKPKLPTLREFYPEENGCMNIFPVKHEKVENPLEILLARELYKTCEQSDAVLLFHRNSMTGFERHKIWQLAKQNGSLYHRDFNNTIASYAFKCTRYENLLRLCIGHTAILTVQNGGCLSKLLKDLRRKAPQLVLMGGIVEYRFMVAHDIVEHANQGGLDAMRGQLVSLLSAPARTTSSLLTHHQGALVRLLAARADSLKSAS